MMSCLQNMFRDVGLTITEASVTRKYLIQDRKRAFGRREASALDFGLAGAAPLHPQYAMLIPVLYTIFSSQ